MENVIYLDTHVIVWLYSLRIDLLSQKAEMEIEKNDLLISPMVQLELQYLLEIDRISENPVKIINKLSHSIGLQVRSEGFDQIINKAIEYMWTRDPFDRIITAQAAINNIKLLTKDSSILSHYRFAVWDL